MGVVLADIGGGTTDIAIFIEGSIWHTTVLAVGGNHITNDVAVGMRVPFAAAEEAKIEYGHARHETIDPTEVVQVKPSATAVAHRRVRAAIWPRSSSARVEEIFELDLAGDQALRLRRSAAGRAWSCAAARRSCAASASWGGRS